jgi:hypothetical protein
MRRWPDAPNVNLYQGVGTTSVSNSQIAVILNTDLHDLIAYTFEFYPFQILGRLMSYDVLAWAR